MSGGTRFRPLLRQKRQKFVRDFSKNVFFSSRKPTINSSLTERSASLLLSHAARRNENIFLFIFLKLMSIKKKSVFFQMPIIKSRCIRLNVDYKTIAVFFQMSSTKKLTAFASNNDHLKRAKHFKNNFFKLQLFDFNRIYIRRDAFRVIFILGTFLSIINKKSKIKMHLHLLRCINDRQMTDFCRYITTYNSQITRYGYRACCGKVRNVSTFITYNRLLGD